LIIVDVQNDFCPPSGAVAVDKADQIIPIINQLRQQVVFDKVILSQELHPRGHISFHSRHAFSSSNAVLFKNLKLSNGKTQLLLPDHCIIGSQGSEFPVQLDVRSSDFIIKKGLSSDVDSFSCFVDNDGITKTDLANILLKSSTTDVYICGISHDDTVSNTALHSVQQGFQTFVIEDLCPVSNNSAASQTKTKLEKLNVIYIKSSSLLERRDDRRKQVDDYLLKYRIDSLFQNLSTLLMYHKPRDPQKFLITELTKRQNDTKNNCFFTDNDLETMFKMLDPIDKGVITGKQVSFALENLGISSSKMQSEINGDFTLDQWKSLAKESLSNI